MFEVDKEYWVIYGTTEEQSHACIKVLEIDGQWLKVESDKLDSHLNMAAPYFISARERDRAAEEAVMGHGLTIQLTDKDGNKRQYRPGVD